MKRQVGRLEPPVPLNMRDGIQTLGLIALSSLLVSADSGKAMESPIVEGSAIIEARCLTCHGPSTRMGELDLSTFESAAQGGTRGPAFVPGNPEQSLLIDRVLADEMPPESPLSTSEKDALRAWIAVGPAWPGIISEQRATPDWWSLQPLQESVPPADSGIPPEWGDSPIDRWVFLGLNRKGLAPAPEAERRTLIRRLSFDLLGLPPSPEDIAAFENDRDPRAYERLVDRLLASPRYGERWGRHWLDLVRYSESEGFERDWLREHVWPYRDYVIRSFNEDRSYLQFAREQMAGDLIDPVTHDGVVATTLLTLGPLDAVGLTSALERERLSIREDHLEEMVGVVGQTFLGLTVHCARCHDHKFDPIPQTDYYRFKAAFQAVWPPTKPNTTGDLDIFIPHGSPLVAPGERRDRDSKIARIASRLDAIQGELGELFRSIRSTRPLAGLSAPYARWTFDIDGRADHAPLHLELHGDALIEDGRLRMRESHDRPEPSPGEEHKQPESVAVSRLIDQQIEAKTLEVWIHVRKAPERSATLMEIYGQSGYRGASVDGIRYVHESVPRWENYSVGSFRSQDTGVQPECLEPGDRLHIAIRYAADGSISLFRNGQPYGESYTPDAGTPAGQLQIYPASDALVRFAVTKDFELEEARLYDRPLSDAQVAASFRAGVVNAGRSELLAEMSEGSRKRVRALERERDRLRADLDSLPKPLLVHSAWTAPARPTHLLERGDVERVGPQVPPGGIAAVQGISPDLRLPADAPDSKKRRALAEWVANASNPLFSRVMANRVWQHHFGNGLVANPSDFGYNGGLPSHPELLDWLAVQLERDDWSVKRLHRRILLSRTYRQSSRYDPAAAAIDSGNRLLWRYPRRRVTAEAVRDSMLAVSGDLNTAMYGPSVRTFKITKAGSLLRYNPVVTNSPDFNRRTVYRMNVISGGDPMLESLDCPLPAVRTPKRSVTTTSLQALSLMNNLFVQHRSVSFVRRLERETAGLDAQAERAFLLALGRRPSADELASSRALVETHGLRALCWGLLNTSEFLYVE